MVTEFYNYVYVDPTTPGRYETELVTFLFAPLYVGKGKRDRCLHGVIALREGKQILTNRLLYQDLKRLDQLGHDPVIVRFNDSTTCEGALQMEDNIIKLWGRRGIEEGGILCNRANGGKIPDISGVPKTDEQNRKMVDTRRARGSYDGGAKHPRAKKFVITSPNGEVYEVVGGIKKFCTEHNLSWQTLYNNRNSGKIVLDRSKYKNVARLSEQFWNTIGWECRSL